MLIIKCPFCGPRNESEFIYGGPAKAKRSRTPASVSDNDWVDYLTVVKNPVGPVVEKWWHVRGCGLWTSIIRDTVTHEIIDPGKVNNDA